MQHNILTSFFILLDKGSQNRKLRNIFTVIFILLGPLLAISTLISADMFQQTTNPMLLRYLLLFDLIYVLIVAGLVSVRITRLVVSTRSRTSGSRLHSRLTKVFTLIALLPTIIVATFATLSINFGLEEWFSSNVQKVVENSMLAAQAYEDEHKNNLINDINYLSNILNRKKIANRLLGEANVRESLDEFQPKNLSEAFIIDMSGNIKLRGDRSYLFDFEKINRDDLLQAINGNTVIITDWPNNEFRALKLLESFNNRLLYVTRDVDGSVLQLLDETQDTVLLYQQIENERYGLLFKFALLYIAFSLVMILIAVWIALWFAESLSKPVGRLAEAAKRVGSGDFDAKVTEESTGDEIAFLSKVFNRMTKKVKEQRDKLLKINQSAEEQRQFLEAVIGGVRGGIISIDLSGRIEIINGAAMSILNLRQKNYSGAKINRIVKEFIPIIKKAKNLKQESIAEELILNRGKKSAHILLRVSTREIGEKNSKGFILTFDDISDLVAAQRNAAWGDVARRIAHEIKNPLTPIKLSAEQLKKKFSSLIKNKNIHLEEYSDMIIRQTEVLQRIVDEFSKFARMPDPQKNKVNINDLINSAVLLQKTVYPKIKFQVIHKNNDINVLIDSGMITQALTNLLKNAAEAVIASSKTKNKKFPIGFIDITLDSSDNKLELKIQDTGLGLDLKKNNFFEPYVTTKIGGTGLGLAIAKKIIEQHDGSLKLYNNEIIVHPNFEKGAIALLMLPLVGNNKSASNSGVSDSKNNNLTENRTESVHL